jgi:hypothetical protein
MKCRVIVPALALLLACATAVSAAEPIVRNGSGVRTKPILGAMYDLELNVPQSLQGADAKTLIEADQPMEFVLTIKSGLINRKRYVEATTEGFAQAAKSGYVSEHKSGVPFAVRRHGIPQGRCHRDALRRRRLRQHLPQAASREGHRASLRRHRAGHPARPRSQASRVRHLARRPPRAGFPPERPAGREIGHALAHGAGPRVSSERASPRPRPHPITSTTAAR